MEEKFIQGEINKATYEKWLIQYKTEQEETKDQSDQIDIKSMKNQHILQQNLQLLTDLKKLFQSVDLQEKASFLRLVFKRVPLLSDDILEPLELNPLFEYKSLNINELSIKKNGTFSRKKAKNPVSTPGGT